MSKILFTSAFAAAVLTAGLTAGVASAAGLEPGRPIPYQVTAAKDASYVLDCKFRKFKETNGAIVNGLTIQGKGPKAGSLPTDNARCVLTKTAGSGAVTVVLTKGQSFTATTSGPAANVQVF
jgi:hypothetical protein